MTKTVRYSDTLDYYDGVQVFEALDTTGRQYVGMMIDTVDGADRYLVTGVTAQRMNQFRSRTVDLRTLLLEGAAEGWYLTQVTDDFAKLLTLEEHDGRLEETNFLPEEGFLLNLSPISTSRRLIEEWLPINEISVDAIREGGALAGHPPVNQLHVWWARRPLVAARAAVAASLLKFDSDHKSFIAAVGSSSAVVSERREMDAAKARGVWSEVTFSNQRAFKHNLTSGEADWLKSNLAVSDPLVVDITAGGGSIPFEAGRLGLRSVANELNPVAGLILRATCQWPQQYGYDLLDAYSAVSGRFRKRVTELLEGAYPPEPQLSEAEKLKEFKTTRAQRYVWSYLWARVVSCPSCKGQVPLSPNWRLTSGGTGIRLVPDVANGTCSFEIVDRVAQQSPGTVKDAIATCPYPNCGATTQRDYISQEAQAGRLSHQLYCVIYRDQWWPLTKSGKPRKRPKTKRGFRIATPRDDNSASVAQRLKELGPQWDAADVLPNEAVPEGNKTREPHRYGMPSWADMFSPRQQLAHGYCVQAFRELVDEDQANGDLDNGRKAAWCYVALALDKLIKH